jgi:hypothetical protein
MIMPQGNTATWVGMSAALNALSKFNSYDRKIFRNQDDTTVGFSEMYSISFYLALGAVRLGIVALRWRNINGEA